jgi:hypothetical protein
MMHGILTESYGGLIVHLKLRCSRLDAGHVSDKPSEPHSLAGHRCCCYVLCLA